MFRGAKTKCEKLLPKNVFLLFFTSLQKYMILFMTPSKRLTFEGKTTPIFINEPNQVNIIDS